MRVNDRAVWEAETRPIREAAEREVMRVALAPLTPLAEDARGRQPIKLAEELDRAERLATKIERDIFTGGGCPTSEDASQDRAWADVERVFEAYEPEFTIGIRVWLLMRARLGAPHQYEWVFGERFAAWWCREQEQPVPGLDRVWARTDYAPRVMINGVEHVAERAWRDPDSFTWALVDGRIYAIDRDDPEDVWSECGLDATELDLEETVIWPPEEKA